ncbi:MAG: helicase [Cressdnaviricota sp.]|nr:MAG: helicase [Cressdnaviricota sp.]
MGPRVRPFRTRSWVFTHNNYTSCPQFDDAMMSYLTYGFETCPTTSTPHLQGFVHFKNAVQMPKAWLPTAHFEAMKGTFDQAIDYCHKASSPPAVEFGTRPLTPAAKGDKNKRRYEEAFALACKGDLDAIPKDLRTRHYNVYNKIKHDHQPKIEDLSILDNLWVYGPTGTGKSRYVRELYPDAYLKNPNKWWDGYTGQSAVIIDDLHPSWTGKAALKNWADHYAFNAESKGSTSMIRPAHICVTSNYSPEQVFLESEDLEPIKRRFKVIYKDNPFDKRK